MSTRYIVHRDGETLDVTIVEEGNGYRLEIDGETVHVDSRSVPGSPTRSLIIDGRAYEAAVMTTRDGLDVFVSGDVFRVRVTDELWARAEEAALAAGAGHEQIASPMPGSVVRIHVEIGQIVKAGETVVVVEAMKMQNDLAAIHGGKVEEIRVKPGDVVDQGTVLVVLGPEEEAAAE